MSASVTVKLSAPVQFGKDSDPVTELVLKPTPRAFKDFSLPMTADNGVLFQPYALALVGLKLAGIAGGPAFLDKMSISDMNEVAREVMGFLNPDPMTGNTP